MKRQIVISLLAAASLTSLCVSAAAQERPDPEHIRKEARELMDTARDLKAQGKTEGAEVLAQRAKELNRQAEQLESKKPEGPPGESERPAPERRRRPPRPPGPPEDLGPGPRGYGAWEREFGPEFGPRAWLGAPGPRPEEVRERIAHVKKAIKHLRAAGLYMPADRLEIRLRQFERALHNRSLSGPHPEDRPRPKPEPRDDGPRPGTP